MSHDPTPTRTTDCQCQSNLVLLLLKTLENLHAEQTSKWTRPYSEEAGSKPSRNPVRRQDDSTAQVTPYCRLYSYLSSQYIFNYSRAVLYM